MFARLEFSTFLVCCSGDFSDNESEEKPSVAICGGSICILTGLCQTIRWSRIMSARIEPSGHFVIATAKLS